MRNVLLMMISIVVFSCPVWGEQGNQFAYVQVRYEGGWDPYPDVHREILSFLVTTTSIKLHPDRKIIGIGSNELFEYPFVLLTGNRNFPEFSKEARNQLIRYLTGGGVIFIEDATGIPGSLFDRAARKFIRQTFSDSPLHIISREHAVMRSFYLLRTVGGRKVIHNYLEGLEIDGRTCLIYSSNDILGAWARDRMGNYLYSCDPGGEKQRRESIKLTANIIMYALTGTYKTDAIHIPFILRKLRSH